MELLVVALDVERMFRYAREARDHLEPLVLLDDAGLPIAVEQRKGPFGERAGRAPHERLDEPILHLVPKPVRVGPR